MTKVLNRALKLAGKSVKVGTPVINAEMFDASNNVTQASGATIPTDGDRGYAPSGIFHSTATNIHYENCGSATSAYFRPFFPMVSPGATALAKTANYTVVAADFGKILTNTGAGGTVVFTLPSAVTYPGMVIRFHLFAAQIVQLLPVTGQAIALNSSSVVTKYLNIAGVIGNYAEIVSDGSQWLVTHFSGVVTKEA
jgi:hypothetical protein